MKFMVFFKKNIVALPILLICDTVLPASDNQDFLRVCEALLLKKAKSLLKPPLS